MKPRRFPALAGAAQRAAPFRFRSIDDSEVAGVGATYALRAELPLVLGDSILAVLQQLRAKPLLALIVGGAVRDALLRLPTKDLDVEVYGISYDRLAKLLLGHGKVRLVGRAFGTIKFVGADGAECDFSIPRLESKVGVGHRGFRTSLSGDLTPAQAAYRRDFTINALAYDALARELRDYYGGLLDLKNRWLRHVSPQFGEDPLRVLRGMQFAARFGLRVHVATARVCRTLIAEYPTLSKERIAEEWMKWAMRSARPSAIFDYLKRTGLGSVYPEIQALYDVPQDPEWHPEGTVDVHTGHVLEAAARIAVRDGLHGDDRAVLMFAALCHDFAKPSTTRGEIKRGRARITSPQHEPLGGAQARRFLRSIGVKLEIVRKVVPLVENHLAHLNPATARSVKRLALRLAPATVAELLRLIEADHSGRPPLPPGLPQQAQRIGELAGAADVQQRPPRPLLLGRHLIDLGFSPSKAFGPALRAAFEAQLDGEFATAEAGIEWLRSYLQRETNELLGESASRRILESASR